MQRLRGLVLGQAAEVEDALALVATRLGSRAKADDMTLGQLAKEVTRLLAPEDAKRWADELIAIGRAIKSRNRAGASPRPHWILLEAVRYGRRRVDTRD